MDIIVGERGSGKTTKLLEDCYRNSGVFVTSNPRWLKLEVERLGYKGMKIISYQEFVSGNFHPDTKFYIDEAQWLLSKVFNKVDIAEITIGIKPPRHEYDEGRDLVLKAIKSEEY